MTQVKNFIYQEQFKKKKKNIQAKSSKILHRLLTRDRGPGALERSWSLSAKVKKPSISDTHVLPPLGWGEKHKSVQFEVLASGIVPYHQESNWSKFQEFWSTFNE